MSTTQTVHGIEKKHNVYRGQDCMKTFCEYLREHAIKIINFKKKKMPKIPYANKKLESYKKTTIYYFRKNARI